MESRLEIDSLMREKPNDRLISTNTTKSIHKLKEEVELRRAENLSRKCNVSSSETKTSKIEMAN